MTDSLQKTNKMVVDDINRIVNVFEDINEAVLQSNRTPVREAQINELIRRTYQVQDDCKRTDDIINSGLNRAVIINAKLETVLNFTLKRLEEKYTAKNEAVNECDELY